MEIQNEDSTKTKKIDLKTILILILLGLTILFVFKWYFSGDAASKERVKQLESDYKKLQEQKKAVDLEIISWQKKSDSLKTIGAKLKSELVKQESETKKAEQDAKRSKVNLDVLKQELEETQKKIKEFKKNPPNRTGESLLKSLKNKTKN